MVLGERETEGAIEVVARYRDEEAACPRCCSPTWRVHQWHRQVKGDAKLWGQGGVGGHYAGDASALGPVARCTGPDPACRPRRRTTWRLRRSLARWAREATVRAAARLEGVSEGLAERSWQEFYGRRLPGRPHRLLGLDGFSYRRRQMWTGLWDLERALPVAFFSGEGQRQVELLLGRYGSVRTVEAVVMDLHEPYRQAVQAVLPQATVVADKFHVLALAARARGEVCREGHRPRGLRWPLQRGGERLGPAEGRRLAAALLADGRLAQAWGLKESLRPLYRLPRLEQAEAALGRWLQGAEASGLAPFQRTARTLERWQREVLNYWRYPIRGALVEGKHNRIKALKRRGYGYRNEGSFLLRIGSQIHTD